MKLHAIRKDYQLATLSEKNVDKNPFVQFDNWMKDAINAQILEPTAMSLSTVNADGFPENRIVLLKFYDKQGFTFFTNYESNKGKSIAQNNKVTLHFFWAELERQVRIRGFATKTPQSINQSYFHSRPVDSQLGAWVSQQSRKILSRAYLQEKVIYYKNKYKEDIPLPDFWGGYKVQPLYFEFWQGGKNRLHDRIIYETTENDWKISRLAP